MLILIMAGILLHISIIMKHSPPREINNLHGFRTKESMKSQKNWDEAHRLLAIYTKRSSFICFILGIFLTIVEIYALVKEKIDTLFTITLIIDAAIVVIILFLILIVVNQKLKNN